MRLYSQTTDTEVCSLWTDYSMYHSGDDFTLWIFQLINCGKSTWQYHLLERKVSQESGMCLLNSRLIAHFQLQLLFGSIILSFGFSLFCCLYKHQTNPRAVCTFYALFSTYCKWLAASLFLNSSKKLKQFSPSTSLCSNKTFVATLNHQASILSLLTRAWNRICRDCNWLKTSALLSLVLLS